MQSEIHLNQYPEPIPTRNSNRYAFNTETEQQNAGMSAWMGTDVP